MRNSNLSSRLFWSVVALAAALFVLYLFRLDGVGVLGPDEPRYAAIGRAMAQTGDWITPRLWGVPWFEKPPLLYWMTALGTRLGLSPDLCGRLPVALLSLLTLGVSGLLLRREYGTTVAIATPALIATSVGWLAFSSVCVTDLPLSALFFLASLLTLRLLRPDAPRPALTFAAIGALLGLAVLAKGLVPVALALPALWFLRRQRRGILISVVTLLAVAAPWYLLVYARNGFPFIEEFFLKHHLQRLYSNSLQHGQPFYYYVPVLLLGLFPWTPLFFNPACWRTSWDVRRRFLFCTVAFGFVFFSVSRNKLPGYLLPLIPLAVLLLTSTWNVLPTKRLTWVAPAVLIGLVPLFSRLLLGSLVQGRITWGHVVHLPLASWIYLALPLLVILFAGRPLAPVLLAISLVANVLALRAQLYPAIDLQVSPRTLWHQTRGVASVTCDAFANRDWVYGLSYYRGRAYPTCDGSGHFRYALRSVPGRRRPDLLPYSP